MRCIDCGNAQKHNTGRGNQKKGLKTIFCPGEINGRGEDITVDPLVDRICDNHVGKTAAEIPETETPTED